MLTTGLGLQTTFSILNKTQRFENRICFCLQVRWLKRQSSLVEDGTEWFVERRCFVVIPDGGHNSESKQPLSTLYDLLGSDAALVCKNLTTFLYFLSVPSSGLVDQGGFSLDLPHLMMRSTGNTETSSDSYKPTLRQTPEEQRQKVYGGKSLKSQPLSIMHYCQNTLQPNRPATFEHSQQKAQELFLVVSFI